jgi:hypothetical protein
MPAEQFGYQIVGGRRIPHTFKPDIHLDGLAIHPKGTSASHSEENLPGFSNVLQCGKPVFLGPALTGAT